MFLEDCEFVEITQNSLTSVRLEDLIKDIANDEGAAKKKYELKVLIVECNVLELSKDAIGGRAILHDNGPRVECTIKEEDFAKLSKGQRIRIRGECFGANKERVSLESAFVLKAK